MTTCMACAYLQVALFAGRRASDPAYLLLQNAFFARHAQGYVGTSSVYAATLLHQVGLRNSVCVWMVI